MESIFQFVYGIIDPQKMWERKVKEDPWMLKYVPDQFKTQEMCEYVFYEIFRVLNIFQSSTLIRKCV